MTFVSEVRFWLLWMMALRRPKRASGKPAPGCDGADFPLWYRCPDLLPYSAFIRAIIFLFAAFSLRFRRSLGFSKC